MCASLTPPRRPLPLAPPSSQELQDFVKRLLVRRPVQRLGVQAGGADDIKRHPWFAGFDWAAFEARTIKAPYVPRVRGWGARVLGRGMLGARLRHAAAAHLAASPAQSGGPPPAPPSPTPILTPCQVSHPGDASNFKPMVDESSAGGAYRGQPYKTTGDFTSF
jgi:hypothetical protein